MPNWCSNSLTTTHPKFLVTVRDHANEHGVIEPFFTHFIPCPAELQDITRGSREINGVKVSHWRDSGDGNSVAVSKEELADYRHRFGAIDWYDWSIANWGTKWDTEAQLSDGRLHFETAWSPPEAFVTELSYLFPGHDFVLAFAEGGMGFYGTSTFRDGEKVNELVHDGQFWSDQEDANGNVNPTPQCQEFLIRHGLGTGG